MKIDRHFKWVWLDYCFYLALILILASIVWVFLCSPNKNIGFNQEDAMPFTDNWEISWGNQQTEAPLPTIIKNPKGERITLRTTLDATEFPSDSILYYSRQSRSIVSVDGIELWDSGEAVATPFPSSYGSFWNCVRLPKDWEGKELCIELIPQFSSPAVANELQPVYIGTKTSFVYKVLKDGLFHIIFCIFLFMLGMVDMLHGIFYIHRTKSSQIFFLGAFAVCISVWMLLESRVIQLVSGNLAVNYLILAVSFELMPIFAVKFFLTYENIRRQIYMRILYGVGILMFVCMRVVCMLGIRQQFEIQFIVQIYAVAALLGLLFYLISFWRKDKPAYEKKLYYGICILFISSVLELLHFYFISREKSGFVLQIGLGLFICYLGISIITEGRKLRVDDLEKQTLAAMAFTDGLTRMQNRFAFEEEMGRMRGEKMGHVAVMVADINNLKVINDKYGHVSGDDAIKRVGSAIECTFGDMAKCFRIGGDEFCVIGFGLDAAAMQTRIRAIETTIYEFKTQYLLQVSIGVSEAEAKDIDAAFRQADQRMYEAKKKAKMLHEERN